MANVSFLITLYVTLLIPASWKEVICQQFAQPVALC